jgi:hypothetical protein
MPRRVQKLPRSLQLMQGSKYGTGDSMGNQVQFLEDVVRGSCPEWSRADHGGMLGARSGRTPLDNQGHALVSEHFEVNPFVRFRLNCR